MITKYKIYSNYVNAKRALDAYNKNELEICTKETESIQAMLISNSIIDVNEYAWKLAVIDKNVPTGITIDDENKRIVATYVDIETLSYFTIITTRVQYYAYLLEYEKIVELAGTTVRFEAFQDDKSEPVADPALYFNYRDKLEGK